MCIFSFLELNDVNKTIITLLLLSINKQTNLKYYLAVIKYKCQT